MNCNKGVHKRWNRTCLIIEMRTGYRVITPILRKGDFGYNNTTITVICGGEHGRIWSNVVSVCVSIIVWHLQEANMC